MANKTMHHVVIGADTFELIDEAGREETTALKEDYAQILDSAYVTDTASGSISSFPDGADGVPVKDLKVNIEPVQDLHGYDHPWASGGKNLLNNQKESTTINGITFTVNSNGTVTATGTATNDASFTIPFENLSGDFYFTGCPSGGSIITYDCFAWDSTVGARFKEWDGTTAVTSDFGKTLQQVQIPSGHFGYISCRVHAGVTVNGIVFEPMIVASSETDSTYAPYSNICPITGWTGAKVTRCGKNLLIMGADTYPLSRNGVTWTKNADGSITANGTATSESKVYFGISNNTVIVPSTMYRFGGCPDDGGNEKFDIYPWDSTANARPQRAETDTRAAQSVYNSTSTGTFYMLKGHVIQITIRIRSGVTVENLTFHPFCIPDGADASWESPVGDTYPITFPSSAGTVYGGTLDVTTGTLTVTHKLYTFDGSENWVAGNHGNRYEFNIGGLPDYIKTWNSGGRGLSNIGIYDSTAYINDVNYITSRATVGASNTGVKTHILVVPASIATTVEELKAFLANNPEQWYAPLQNPQVIQLSGQDISTLLGQNNIWSDAGTVDVEYRADTKLYIEKLTAPTEDDMIADHAIEANTFFMIGNTLYRATTAIANGATITVGTNATKLSLSDALNALA